MKSETEACEHAAVLRLVAWRHWPEWNGEVGYEAVFGNRGKYKACLVILSRRSSWPYVMVEGSSLQRARMLATALRG
jgi:hypothetical protein